MKTSLVNHINKKSKKIYLIPTILLSERIISDKKIQNVSFLFLQFEFKLFFTKSI